MKRRMHLKAAERASKKAAAIAVRQSPLTKRQSDRLDFLNDIVAMHLNASDQIGRVIAENAVVRS